MTDRYVKGALHTTITAIAIHRTGYSPFFGESATIVRDEAADDLFRDEASEPMRRAV